MGNIEKGIFQRSELLFGSEKMALLSTKRVIIFGIGGVGSWCAESLVRTGIRQLTIVDFDDICVSNINRQLHATTQTIGLAKVEVLKNRLLEINPTAEILALQKIYTADTHDSFDLDAYDFIIDAIDSLDSKVHLIRMATHTNATFFSSMGAALKLDSTRIKIAEFWKVHTCPLAAAIRQRIKKGDLPAKKFLCVYSDELLENKGISSVEAIHSAEVEETHLKKRVNGTVSHITAIFGFTLAGLVIQSIVGEES